ncbi:hypothetical protein COY87_02295 [Candidatus Roizmanbacteria bacterium CG_4_10_14_0_8_um_filter_33_9]|uniref:YYY membrane protein n=1 Tax=Candidatus Roizmanbacteria bacterium CG_4_10_14_0_8_um_filter_33_9 TaxID=1974826 RepID=A0A2M7QIQ4_9BACT|nr:MAG: hypothetical protein COY87_02295 [Candidatus Roizmanbacteria bacterium CG_4_10_14_0_8_um_filter_33_9]
MNWITQSLTWYLFLLPLGFIGYLFVKKFLFPFFDGGYAFGKTITILLLTYTMFIFGIAKILPFTQLSLFFILSVFIAGVIMLRKKYKKYNKLFENRTQLYILIGEELLFLASLLFLTFIRGQEPSLHGLEKFMDYGFIQSILRSKFFPPLDMWLSSDLIRPEGYPINYYYFGHLSGAILIKLTGITPSVGYNLILATIFAQAITIVFSLVGNIVYLFSKKIVPSLFFGFLGSIIVNFGGNLHTVYLFTKGYAPENPVPFWTILSNYNPAKYWYPNATRFIPFTIHEFPSYSYVVADLHGHVFDIPFVLLTLTVLFMFFINRKKIVNLYYLILNSVVLGFLTATYYMTNAFDGPIYILLSIVCFVVILGFTTNLIIACGVLFVSFLIFSFPFSIFFSPFVSGIGVNCAPKFLTDIGKMGPFLFESGNCQSDAWWMLFVLWGFFWIAFVTFPIIKWFEQRKKPITQIQTHIDDFIFILFSFGTLFILIPEFFYIKDIYPAHFRANTMFKLGYQAFIMMGIAAAYIFFRLRYVKHRYVSLFKILLIVSFLFVFIYPFYSFPSYYGSLQKTPNLDGIEWLNRDYPENHEIIDYINKNISGQPVILEAQGDSYTDYNYISAYTGLPTVAGWWVHEWLWRGSSTVVSDRIPDIIALYESKDIVKTKELIEKYGIKYIVVSSMEKKKYKNLYEAKFAEIANKIYTSSNGFGALYQVK